MTRKVPMLLTAMLLLSGCSYMIPIDETEPEVVPMGDQYVRFETNLPTMKVGDTEFLIGDIPSDDMISLIDKFYVSHEQYHEDLDGTLLSHNEWEENKEEFDKIDMENDELSVEQVDSVKTRVIFGGQCDDNSYLSFSVSNLTEAPQNNMICTVTNTSCLYGDTLGKVTYNDIEVLTKDDMVTLMGDNYTERDVSEYDYIYDKMYIYQLTEYCNMTFLCNGDEVVGVQQADLGMYSNLYKGVE